MNSVNIADMKQESNFAAFSTSIWNRDEYDSSHLQGHRFVN